MKENLSNLFRAEQKLNATVLRGENTMLSLEGFNFRFVEQRKESVSSTYTPYQHQHTHFEMHMPVTGMQSYQLGEEIVTVHPFEMIIFPPHTMHAIVYSSENLQKFSASFIMLEDAQTGDFAWVGKELRSHSCLTAKADEWHGALFRRLFREAELSQPGWTTLVVNMLSQLVIDIARENLPVEKKHSDAGSLQRKRIESIERFISDNISATITDKMVAQHMYLSIRQIDRVVMAERGMTLKALIDSMKIREARRLLSETRLGQKEISTTLGFSEVSAFNRFFRRFEGVSPGIYRNCSGFDSDEKAPQEARENKGETETH